MYKIITIAIAVFMSNIMIAQEPGKQQSIDINSAYKPVLRNAVKINFAGTFLPVDTSKPILQYNIPSQNLLYGYMPISLKPLALVQDTNLYLGNKNYVKLGYGNYNSPYVGVGLSIGDGKKSLLNFTGDYIKATGNIANQQYSQLNTAIAGSYFLPKNELYGSTKFQVHNYNLYGYDHAVYNFSKAQVQQQLQTASLLVGYKNTVENNAGINYNPTINLEVFANKNKATETNAIINLPASKMINEKLTAAVTIIADLTQYTKNNVGNSNTLKINNNIFQIVPTIQYQNDVVKLTVGATPIFNNSTYEILPNLQGEAQIKDNVFAVQAGIVGRITKNNYKNLTSINPYLTPLTTQINTTETEIYGGIKTSIAKHFNFSAKAGFVKYKNLPLFINDSTLVENERQFIISNEKNINNLKLHADFSYINKDKFELTAAITFNGYTGLKTNAMAWHTLPVELKSALRWQLFKKLLVKYDVYIFDGSNYLTKGNTAKSLGGGTDVSAGLEYQLTKKIAIWGDANNILNNTYQRWHNYEVYGANFMGGIILNF